jgi:hypothetical protein
MIAEPAASNASRSLSKASLLFDSDHGSRRDLVRREGRWWIAATQNTPVKPDASVTLEDK